MEVGVIVVFCVHLHRVEWVNVACFLLISGAKFLFFTRQEGEGFPLQNT